MTDAVPQIVWRSGQVLSELPAKSFLPLLRAAVAMQGDRLDLLQDLVIALRDDRCWAEIVERLSPRLEADELTLILRCELAQAAIADEQPELALKALDVVDIEGSPELCRQRVFALYALNRTDEARKRAVQVLNDVPGDRTILTTFANDCLTRGNAEVLIPVCWTAIDKGVGSTLHFAYLSAALSLAGRTSEVYCLMDPARFCRRIELASEQVDNEELAAAILTHPDLAPSPEIKPTQGQNLRLEGLAGLKHPAIRNLLAIVRREIDAYLADCLRTPHPLLAYRPKAALLQGWGLVLSNDGHEITHIHPRGWLTVVYYVRTPKGPRQQPESDAPPGSLTFGPWPPSIAETLPEFPRWHQEPQEGTLLIFPSFFGHGTVPTGVDAPRICVALDVIPCN